MAGSGIGWQPSVGGATDRAGNDGVTVTFDRTLNDAHRLLREGRIDGAITAYAAVLEAHPDDWTAANRLADLYMQTGKTQEAVEQVTRVAQQLLDRDQLPKAAALYKKVLKIAPGDEHARMQLAEIAERRGLLVDARAHLAALAEHRRRTGDDQGAMEADRRIESLSDTRPDDPPAITAPAPAAGRPDRDDDWMEINTQVLDEQDQADGSPDAPPAAAPAGDDQGAMEVGHSIEGRSDMGPDDAPAITAPAPAASRPDRDDDWLVVNTRVLDEQDQADGSPDAPPAAAPTGAAEPVASRPDPPADDRAPTEAPLVQEDLQPSALRQLELTLMPIENEIRAGQLQRARRLVGTVLAAALDGVDQVVDLAKRMTGEHAEATVMCAEAILEAGERRDDWTVTAEAVRELAVWVPAQPEGRQWPPAQLQRLGRAGAIARLETMYRAILQTYPDLKVEVGGH